MLIKIDQNFKLQHKIKQLKIYSKIYIKIKYDSAQLVTFSNTIFKLRDKNKKTEIRNLKIDA